MMCGSQNPPFFVKGQGYTFALKVILSSIIFKHMCWDSQDSFNQGFMNNLAQLFGTSSPVSNVKGSH